MFDGRLVERGSADYEATRIDALFNARLPARYPAAVLEAASEADVVAGVKLAAERGWKIAARSGGHAWAGWSVRDDALLIDLAGLREMTVDVAQPSVRRCAAGRILRRSCASTGWSFPVGTARRSGSVATCCRAARGGTRERGVGHARTCSVSTWSPPTELWFMPTR